MEKDRKPILLQSMLGSRCQPFRDHSGTVKQTAEDVGQSKEAQLQGHTCP